MEFMKLLLIFCACFCTGYALQPLSDLKALQQRLAFMEEKNAELIDEIEAVRAENAKENQDIRMELSKKIDDLNLVCKKHTTDHIPGE